MSREYLFKMIILVTYYKATEIKTVKYWLREKGTSEAE